jgi:hypothetical protein
MLDNFSCAFSSTPFLNNLLFNSNYPNSRKGRKKGGKFEDNKGVIRSRKLNNRQYNGKNGGKTTKGQQ